MVYLDSIYRLKIVSVDCDIKGLCSVRPWHLTGFPFLFHHCEVHKVHVGLVFRITHLDFALHHKLHFCPIPHQKGFICWLNFGFIIGQCLLGLPLPHCPTETLFLCLQCPFLHISGCPQSLSSCCLMLQYSNIVSLHILIFQPLPHNLDGSQSSAAAFSFQSGFIPYISCGQLRMLDIFLS